MAQRIATLSSGVYPAATAAHAEVVADKKKFENTLHSLLHHLATPLKPRCVAFQPVDWHGLYKSVTARNGIQEVIDKKLWKKIGTDDLGLSCTDTISYHLRNAYELYLFHYEQLYFHGAQAGSTLRPLPPRERTKAKRRRDGEQQQQQQQQQQQSADLSVGACLTINLTGVHNGAGGCAAGLAAPSLKRLRGVVQLLPMQAPAGVQHQPATPATPWHEASGSPTSSAGRTPWLGGRVPSGGREAGPAVAGSSDGGSSGAQCVAAGYAAAASAAPASAGWQPWWQSSAGRGAAPAARPAPVSLTTPMYQNCWPEVAMHMHAQPGQARCHCFNVQQQQPCAGCSSARPDLVRRGSSSDSSNSNIARCGCGAPGVAAAAVAQASWNPSPGSSAGGYCGGYNSFGGAPLSDVYAAAAAPEAEQQFNNVPDLLPPSATVPTSASACASAVEQPPRRSTAEDFAILAACVCATGEEQPCDDAFELPPRRSTAEDFAILAACICATAEEQPCDDAFELPPRRSTAEDFATLAACVCAPADSEEQPCDDAFELPPRRSTAEDYAVLAAAALGGLDTEL